MNDKAIKMASFTASIIGILAVLMGMFTLLGAVNFDSSAFAILAAVIALCACVALYGAYHALKITRSPVLGRMPQYAYLAMAVFAIVFAVASFVKADITEALFICAAALLLFWCVSLMSKYAALAAVAFIAAMLAAMFNLISFYIAIAVMGVLLAIYGLAALKKGGIYAPFGVCTGVVTAALAALGIFLMDINLLPWICLAILMLIFVMTGAGAFKTLIPAAALTERELAGKKDKNVEIKEKEPEEVIRAAKKGKGSGKKAAVPPLPNAVPEKVTGGNAYARAVGRAYGGSTKIASAAADNKKAVENDAKMKMVDKEYQHLTWQQLLTAPVSALKGVSKDDEALLTNAFGIKTIGDLADNKFFNVAEEVTKNLQ